MRPLGPWKVPCDLQVQDPSGFSQKWVANSSTLPGHATFGPIEARPTVGPLSFGNAPIRALGGSQDSPDNVVFAHGGHLEQFIKHFRREKPGEWVCTSPATLETPKGRVQVNAGTRLVQDQPFMNVDLARMLEDAYLRFMSGR